MMPFLKLQSNAKTTSKINKLKEYKQYETKKQKGFQQRESLS
ncbi:hypothetical protein [Helicobacter winghamensis]|nr:hypothetical protein [Helicobacter winghamensis]